MRIWAIVEGIEKEAYVIGGSGYDCYPASTNEKHAARSFVHIEEAAVFLLTHPTWGIRMNPGSAQLFIGELISLGNR